MVWKCSVQGEWVVILHSGRPVPADGNIALRNEGVAIVLDPALAENWKSSGEEWQAISSRIVSARLKLGEKDYRENEGNLCMVQL